MNYYYFNTFIQQGRIKLIKSDSKDMYKVKSFLPHKYCAFWTSLKSCGVFLGGGGGVQINAGGVIFVNF